MNTEKHKKGKQLIAEERAKVLKKISREDDIIENQLGQLSQAAGILTDHFPPISNLKPFPDLIKMWKPSGWDIELWRKMCAKPYIERLVIAGQLYLAEADRCKAMADKLAKLLDLANLQQNEKNKLMNQFDG